MQLLDYAIIVGYLLALVGIGLYFRRKASKNTDSFFLAENELPWWALGASGMAGNLDVSGTMIIASMVYVMGVQAIFVGIRGDVVLILAFLMIFTGKWTRRSGVMTTAEWMEFRFGNEAAGAWARLLSALGQVTFAIWAITYFNKGSGIFLKEILHIDPTQGALLMIGVSIIYAVMSGLYGVVYTEVFQGALVIFVIGYVMIMVMSGYNIPDTFTITVPQVGGGVTSFVQNRADWVHALPFGHQNLPGIYSAYNFIGVATFLYLFRSSIDGMSGSGGYISQRFYAAKNEREVGLMSVLWIFLLSFRWPFVMSMAILAIHYSASHPNLIQDPETVLPVVLMNLFPSGIKGLLVAGLLAAAMSTFVALINSGASYWVNDLYQRFINPKAEAKTLVWHSRLASVAIVALGLVSTFLFQGLNDVWEWLTMGLGFGLIVPDFVRWYWWRFNGYGFAGGTAVGIISAVIPKIIENATGWNLYAHLPSHPAIVEFLPFLWVATLTFAACIGFSLLTPATSMDVLEKFYLKTRPFGFWNPVRQRLDAAEVAEIRIENRRDIQNTFLAVPWQMVLFMTMMLLVTKQWDIFLSLLGLLIVLSVALYFRWFKHLKTEGK
jgi:Na+/proline symporter